MRVMFVSDSLCNYTGFAYVTVSLLKRYAKIHGAENICFVGISNGETKINDLDKFEDGLSDTLKGLRIYNSSIENENDILNFNRAVYEFRPNMVISIHDPWRLQLIVYSQFRSSFFWAAYTMIETKEYPETLIMYSHANKRHRQNIKEILETADMVIPCSRMGYDFLKKWIPDVSGRIYNGLDINHVFTEPVLKSDIYNIEMPENAFVFYSMGTNSQRKQIDRIIDAFTIFMNEMKSGKYYLVLHTGSDINLRGADLYEQIRKSGYEKNIIITGTDSLNPADKRLLYAEYAASDCYIALPGGEGFGYGFAESIMHGKPVIYINHGGHTEYCDGCGISVPVIEYNRVTNSDIKWAIPDTDMAAAAMKRMVSDKKLYQGCKVKALERAKEFDWDSKIFPAFYNDVLWKYEQMAESNLYGLVKRSVI